MAIGKGGREGCASLLLLFLYVLSIVSWAELVVESLEAESVFFSIQASAGSEQTAENKSVMYYF